MQHAVVTGRGRRFERSLNIRLAASAGSQPVGLNVSGAHNFKACLNVGMAIAASE